MSQYSVFVSYKLEDPPAEIKNDRVAVEKRDERFIERKDAEIKAIVADPNRKLRPAGARAASQTRDRVRDLWIEPYNEADGRQAAADLRKAEFSAELVKIDDNGFNFKAEVV